jgi:hypothetical protein
MAAREPTFWDLVVEAFHRKPRVRGLGEVSWNKVALLAVAILGFGNPGFWLLGVAGELAYLYLTATNERFRNVIRGRRLLAERESAVEQIDQWTARLSKAGLERWEALRDNCREVQRIYETLRPAGLSVLDETRWNGLDQLLWLFLRLQLSLDLLDRQMGSTDARPLEREIAAIRAELASLPEGSEALRKSKQSLLELKEKRVENLGRAGEARQVLASELQRIEQQVELLREEAAISRNAEVLSSKIDSIAGTLSESDAWMRQHDDILSDLGVEDVGSTPRILERPPALPAKETA